MMPDAPDPSPFPLHSGRALRGHPERRRVQALDDDALIVAMRAGDEWAWSEFAARARPVLDDYARRARLSGGDRVACTDALLTSVALHLATPGAPTPARLAPYLVRAAVRCRRHAARDRLRRAAWHEAAARDDLGLGVPDGAGVIASAVSEHARRAAAGTVPNGAPEDAPDDAPNDTPAARAVAAVVRDVVDALSPTDRELLTWYADGVPHRQIAEWRGATYAAVAKRVQRLCHRLAARARAVAATLPADERAALAGFLRRAMPADVAPRAVPARVAEGAGAAYAAPATEDDRGG